MHMSLWGTNCERIKYSDLGRYVVSTIKVDDPKKMIFYETMILSTSPVPSQKDPLNGTRMVCALKKNACKAHKDYIHLVKQYLK